MKKSPRFSLLHKGEVKRPGLFTAASIQMTGSFPIVTKQALQLAHLNLQTSREHGNWNTVFKLKIRKNTPRGFES